MQNIRAGQDSTSHLRQMGTQPQRGYGMAQGHFSLKGSLLNWVPSHKREHTFLCQGLAAPQPLLQQSALGQPINRSLRIHTAVWFALTVIRT